MSPLIKPFHIAIDGNEANVKERVGSNVYAFELLSELELLTRGNQSQAVTILLHKPPLSDMPKERKGWRYQVLTPTLFWTQWALPLHLYQKKNVYDVFFTPGHYAPRLCPIPYISSVMDTAYLDYPKQFTGKDRLQLQKWTEYSVRNAQRILAISRATKQKVHDHYGRTDDSIFVAYPAVRPLREKLSVPEQQQFFASHQISMPYFLFVGTLQPRKNLSTVVAAYEQFRSEYQESKEFFATTSKRTSKKLAKPPTLVLAGKAGWMSEPILSQIAQSPYKESIIITGFITDLEKKALMEHSVALLLIGLLEGFGIPPLEALHYGTIPIVSNTSSLPEVVGDAGVQVDPLDTSGVTQALWRTFLLKARERAELLKKGREQAHRFSWSQSAQEVLVMLQKVGMERASA